MQLANHRLAIQSETIHDQGDFSSSMESILSSKSKSSKFSSRKSSGKLTLDIGKSWKSKAIGKKVEGSAATKRKFMKQKSKSIDDTLESSSSPPMPKKHSYSCSELGKFWMNFLIFQRKFHKKVEWERIVSKWNWILSCMLMSLLRYHIVNNCLCANFTQTKIT